MNPPSYGEKNSKNVLADVLSVVKDIKTLWFDEAKSTIADLLSK